MSLQSNNQCELPRERLLRAGAKALSDSELIAILLRTGNAKQNAIEMANALLYRFGQLQSLLTAPANTLLATTGLGASKVSTLLACGELSHRLSGETATKGVCIEGAITAARLARQYLTNDEIEICGAMFLDLSHRLLAFEELARGSLTEVVVYPREVIRRALLHNASALILVHTHPGGDQAASAADIEMTEILAEGLSRVDVQLLDHIILAGGNSLSLAQQGLMPRSEALKGGRRVD
ncbi:MAG: DNA repair protein RadC [Gammaproteobacteria bacterium]|nr:DNA repair protein RadC [Gammaproteobacteria bacterium]